jgi:3D (Asp-Asp-Asp) domain-containing protein
MKLAIAIILAVVTAAQAEVWTVTAYCPCRQCCGKADGIMASGKRVHVGAVAVNHLPFGTRLYVDGIGAVTVEDIGHKRYFGTHTRRVKRMDIFMPTHQQAVAFGVRTLNVERFQPIMVAGDCSILVW